MKDATRGMDLFVIGLDSLVAGHEEVVYSEAGVVNTMSRARTRVVSRSMFRTCADGQYNNDICLSDHAHAHARARRRQ